MAYIETPADWAIKYEGCFAKVADPGLYSNSVAPVVKIGDVFHTSGGLGKVSKLDVTLFKLNKNNQTYRAYDTVNVKDLKLTPLTLGAINMAMSVVVLKSVKPDGSAKYRKLPTKAHIRIHDPFKQERDFLEERQVPGLEDYFILSAWADRKYFTAPEALSLVMDHKRLGAAFSKDYYFGISLAGDSIFLYHQQNRIARVNEKGEILLKPVVHCLNEQLSEFGLSVKMVNK